MHQLDASNIKHLSELCDNPEACRGHKIGDCGLIIMEAADRALPLELSMTGCSRKWPSRHRHSDRRG